MPHAEKPHLIVFISSDPRASHRPAEAIRLAARVAAWKKVAVTVVLAGPAVAALNPDTDDFVDEESYAKYLPLLVQEGEPVWVDAEFQQGRTNGSIPFKVVSRQELASACGAATYSLRF